MIIENSNIQMSAEHQKFEFREQSSSHQGFMLELSAVQLEMSSLRVSQAADFGTLPGLGNSILPGLFSLLPGEFSNSFRLARADQVQEPVSSGFHTSSTRLFQALFEAITGRVNRISEPGISGDATVAGTAAGSATDASADADLDSTEAPATDTPPSLWDRPIAGRQRTISVDVKVTEYYKESECTSFCATGSVETTDGEVFDLDLNLEMFRSYESTTEYQRTEEVVFTDPLVINFNGTAAELTEEKYEFDLDVDGETEWISFVNDDSGLLALDINGDGQINDGSELFGAISGDGFSDLAAWDEDMNGFIDEADSIFADLKIWSKQDGEDQLDSLLDRNVGAIYLGSTDTPFDLKDDDNEMQGRIRQSGIYLDEEGGTGTVQQIDMAV